MIKRKSSWKIAFPVASVWFGALVGPSMISGAFSAVYFAPYGALGLLLPILTIGLASIVIGMGAEIARLEKAYDYSEFANSIYGSLAQILRPVLEAFMILAMIVGGSAVVAMGGTFFSSLLNAPEIVGSLIMSIISIILVLWGAGLLRKVSSIMSITMICGMIFLVIFSITNRIDGLKEVLSTFSLPEGVYLKAGIMGAIALGCSNSINALTLCSVEQEVSSRRDSIAIAIISFIMNSFAFIISTLTILPYGSDILADSVPVLTIIQNHLVQRAPWLPTVYSVTMFIALVSSGAPQLHAVAARILTIYPKKKSGIFKNDFRKNLFTGVIYFAICLAISTLGLRTIINKGYAMLGSLAIPLIIIPICIIMPLRWRRQEIEKTTIIPIHSNEL